MEGITHGIRPEGTKKVHIQAPPKEEVKKLDSKAKLQKKFGIKTLEEKKKEEKSNKKLYSFPIICLKKHVGTSGNYRNERECWLE